MTNLVTRPTHQGSVLDVILTDAEWYTNDTTSGTTHHPSIGLSKHDCILSRPAPPTPPTYSTRTYRPWRDSSVREFAQWVLEEEWVEILRSEDVNDCVRLFKTTVLNHYHLCFPSKQVRVRAENRPWLTPHIVRLMRQRRSEWHRRGRSQAWHVLYRRIRQELRQSKRNTARDVEQHPTNSVKFAKRIKTVLGIKKKKLKLKCFHNLNSNEISCKIRDHFTAICTKHPPLNNTKLPAYLPANNDLPVIDRMTIYNELSKLNLNKASPVNEIPKRLLKEFAYEFSVPLTHIYNLSISSGVFPDRWKTATITPLPKVKDVTEMGELRPVSLTNDLGKILEGLITKVMIADIKDNIDHRQYGNLKGRSTSHYLIYLLDEIHRGLEGKNTIANLVLIDFRKAFDYVDHNVAIADLIELGCRPSIIPFVSSFLTDRQHRVRYEDAVSPYAPITCGVPQGIRAGGIIFLALINSVCKLVERRAKFVDDLTLAHIINIFNTIDFTEIQQNLDTLNEEVSNKNMETNPIKCESLYAIPSKRKRPITLPDLKINGTPLPVVHQCKLLGVHINSGLDWNTHIAEIIAKANRCIFILINARKFQFSLKSLVTLYTWYIRTSLEYAAPVWHPGLTAAQHNPLERIQKRCVRIILGREYTGYAEALERLGLESLYSRREMLTLRLGRSMLRSQDHRDLFPPTMRAVHGRNTRHGQRLRTVRGSARYRATFIPYVVKMINESL